MRSWRKTLTGLLAFLLILLLGFLAWTNISYYRQSVENIRQQNIHTAELWENSVGTRLNMLYEHLYELLLTIYNNTCLLYTSVRPDIRCAPTFYGVCQLV